MARTGTATRVGTTNPWVVDMPDDPKDKILLMMEEIDEEGEPVFHDEL